MVLSNSKWIYDTDSYPKINIFKLYNIESLQSMPGLLKNSAQDIPHQIQKKPDSISYIVKYSLGGGITGSAAMACQVSLLMWMRTVMNYQYRFAEAGNFFHAFKHLYKDGGLLRLYRGYPQAMLQAPLSRFGDAAANEMALMLSERSTHLSNLPVALKTALASVLAAFWRLNLMPIDAWKTIKQVEGSKGTALLVEKIKKNGIPVLYYGMGATFAATITGHYPWFVTYNYLSQKLPKPNKPATSPLLPLSNHNKNSHKNNTHGNLEQNKVSYYDPPALTSNARFNYEICNLSRQALIGFAASVVSDTVTNSLRVIKTVKQTSVTALSYKGVLEKIRQDNANNRKAIGAKHGKEPKLLIFGSGSVFTRGLGTRIAVNGLQGLTFSVLWKVFMDHYYATFLKQSDKHDR